MPLLMLTAAWTEFLEFTILTLLRNRLHSPSTGDGYVTFTGSYHVEIECQARCPLGCAQFQVHTLPHMRLDSIPVVVYFQADYLG